MKRHLKALAITIACCVFIAGYFWFLGWLFDYIPVRVFLCICVMAFVGWLYSVVYKDLTPETFAPYQPTQERIRAIESVNTAEPILIIHPDQLHKYVIEKDASGRVWVILKHHQQ